jgi:hypothetical protein
MSSIFGKKFGYTDSADLYVGLNEGTKFFTVREKDERGWYTGKVQMYKTSEDAFESELIQDYINEK